MLELMLKVQQCMFSFLKYRNQNKENLIEILEKERKEQVIIFNKFC